MAYTETFAQELSVVDVLNYGTVTNQSVNSAYGINMANCRRAGYVIQVDSLGSGGTIDARLQAAATSSFSGAVNLTGTNLTQVTTTTTPSGNNTTYLIEVRSDQLAQQGNNLEWVRLNLTGAVVPVTVSAVGYGKDCPQKPASQYNTVNLCMQEVQCSL